MSIFQQTEELYEEILYEILHNVGCETENETCQTTLYSYIQDAFKVIPYIFYVRNFMILILVAICKFADDKCSPRRATYSRISEKAARDAFECRGNRSSKPRTKRSKWLIRSICNHVHWIGTCTSI